MLLLGLGVILFCLVHLVPSALPDLRANLVDKMGEMGFKGLFAVASIVGIVLIVLGWQQAVPAQVYLLPEAATRATKALMIFALILFFAPYIPTNIRRAVRHPQLTGVLVWSIAHLLANGDNRSIVLFGGMAMWSVVAMALISGRDGDWVPPEPKSPIGDAVAVIVGVVAFIGLVLMHQSLFGGV
ncbi:MAG: NnrU family protein, partial [Alphaproteobacteria bacterium]|nr:NnrU family protein [Alphaproteobacteria bacterium]